MNILLYLFINETLRFYAKAFWSPLKILRFLQEIFKGMRFYLKFSF